MTEKDHLDELVNNVRELLPCPFCGSAPEMVKTWVRSSKERLMICSNHRCVAHNAEQDEQGGWLCDSYFNDQDAISAWNTRTPPKP